MILIDSSCALLASGSLVTMVISGLPKSVTYGETISANLKFSQIPVRYSSDQVILQLVGIEHAANAGWCATTPRMRTFLCAQKSLSMDGLVKVESEYVLPFSIRFPDFALDDSGISRCKYPPTVGAGDKTYDSTPGICVQYFVKAYISSSRSLAHKSITLETDTTHFDLPYFVDASGAALARTYSASAQIFAGRFRKTLKGAVKLTGGPLNASDGEASFEMHTSLDVSESLCLSYEIHQLQYSSIAGLNRILDETTSIDVRKAKVAGADIIDYHWDENSSRLLFAYEYANLVPSYISELTAVSYELKVVLNYERTRIELAVPLVVGGAQSAPPPYI